MTDVLEIMKQHVTCTTCFNIFTDPRQLLCGHAICFSCYEKSFKDTNHVKCQTCQKLSNCEPEDLKKFIVVSEYLETYISFVKEAATTSSEAVLTSHDLSEDGPKGRKCDIPKCLRQAEGKSCHSNLKMCQKHLNDDLMSLAKEMAMIEEKVGKRLKEEGGIDDVSRKLKTAIAKDKVLMTEIQKQFRQLIKIIETKQEELLSKLDSHVTENLVKLNAVKEESNCFHLKVRELNESKDNPEACVELLKQLDILLNHVEILEKNPRPLKLNLPLVKELHEIEERVGKMDCFNFTSDNDMGNEALHATSVLVEDVSPADTEESMLKTFEEWEPLSVQIIKDINGYPFFGILTFSSVPNVRKIMETKVQKTLLILEETTTRHTETNSAALMHKSNMGNIARRYGKTSGTLIDQNSSLNAITAFKLSFN